MSSTGGESVTDTVVVLYFAITGKLDLLLDLVGRPLMVPSSVYDPDEIGVPLDVVSRPEFLSEIRQAMHHYSVSANDGVPEASLCLERLLLLDAMFAAGDVVCVQLSEEELALAARLQTTDGAREVGRRAPLGPGEAACIAIAFARGWTIVTDDTDALAAMTALHDGNSYGYERIRKLLIRAVEEGLVLVEEAKEIHEEMKRRGFWDQGSLGGLQQ